MPQYFCSSEVQFYSEIWDYSSSSPQNVKLQNPGSRGFMTVIFISLNILLQYNNRRILSIHLPGKYILYGDIFLFHLLQHKIRNLSYIFLVRESRGEKVQYAILTDALEGGRIIDIENP